MFLFLQVKVTGKGKVDPDAGDSRSTLAISKSPPWTLALTV